MSDQHYLAELKQLRSDVVAAMPSTFSGGKRATAEFSIRNRDHRMDSLVDCLEFLQWINDENGRDVGLREKIQLVIAREKWKAEERERGGAAWEAGRCEWAGGRGV